MDLTSGRWPRWVARYEKGGGGGGGVGSPLQVQYTKSGGGGGAIRFRSIMKSGGGGGNSLQVHYEKWGGGGSDVSSPIGVWGKAPEASQAGTHTT